MSQWDSAVTPCRQAQYYLCSSLACLDVSRRRKRKHHQSFPQTVYFFLPPLPAGSLWGSQAAGWVWRASGWWPPRCIMFPLRDKAGDSCSGSWGLDWLRTAGYAGCHSSSWSCDQRNLCASFQRSWCSTTGNCTPSSRDACAGDTGILGCEWRPAWTHGCSRGRWWGSGSCWSSQARRWLWRGRRVGASSH